MAGPERLVVPWELLETVAGKKEAWNTLLNLLLLQPDLGFERLSVTFCPRSPLPLTDQV